MRVECGEPGTIDLSTPRCRQQTKVMKHPKSLPTHPLVALAALGSVVVIGCRDAKGPDKAVQESQAAAASQAAPVPVIDAQQFGILTNQFALAQKAQLELIQRLQGQVVALEQRNSE